MFEYYTIGIIALLAAVSPGPDFAIVLRNALGHHERAGIFTALGISAGILVHTSYCLLGLALIISQSIRALTASMRAMNVFLLYNKFSQPLANIN